MPSTPNQLAAIPDHAWMSIEALKAGKHVACTVPMATTLADCKKIVDCRRRPA
jgi:predicted dehydrogenase